MTIMENMMNVFLLFCFTLVTIGVLFTQINAKNKFIQFVKENELYYHENTLKELDFRSLCIYINYIILIIEIICLTMLLVKYYF